MSEKRPLLPDEEFLIRQPLRDKQPIPKPEEQQHLKPEEESAEVLERFLHEKKPGDALDTLAEDPIVYMTPR